MAGEMRVWIVIMRSWRGVKSMVRTTTRARARYLAAAALVESYDVTMRDALADVASCRLLGEPKMRAGPEGCYTEDGLFSTSAYARTIDTRR